MPATGRASPHKLRHTFASLLVLGTDPGAVMDQPGHEDAGFTLRVYRHGMRRDEDSRAALARLVGVDAPTKRHRKVTCSVSESAATAIEGNASGRKAAH